MAGFKKETRCASREEKIRLNTTAPQVTFLHRIAGFVGAGYLHFVGKTSVLHLFDHPLAMTLRREKKPVIYAFWHNAQVFLAYAHRGEGANVIVSQSKDGEYIAQVMKRLGLHAVRGSTSRGGEQALREMCKLLEEGKQVGFTPDGPRGPSQTVHGGIVMAAQTSQVPIIPVTYDTSRKIIFNSWDKFILPLPFGSIVVRHGQPFSIEPLLDMESAKERIRQHLNKNVDETLELQKNLPNWPFSCMGFIFEIVYTLLCLVFSPLIAVGVAFKYGFKRTVRYFKERISIDVPPPAGKRMWFHSASVGEWQALKPILNQFKSIPQLEFVVTVSTPEARALIEREEKEAIVRLLPIDLPWLVKRAVRKISPVAVCVVETEMWPNLLTSLRKRAIPVFLLNGRLSNRSVNRWKLVKPFSQRLLEGIGTLFARTDLDGRRFVELGFPYSRVRVVGNSKVDNLRLEFPTPEGLAVKYARRKELFGNFEGVLIVAGSTWTGEEELLLDLFKQKIPEKFRLILAPRRLERCAEIEALLKQVTVSWSLWSKIKSTREWDTDILLVDTIGDLKTLIGVSDIGFVGGSINPRGGQNPLEAAAAGIPVLFGPSMENFHEEAADLKRSGGARQSRNGKDLLLDIQELIRDEDLRYSIGNAAARYVELKQGASGRVVSEIKSQLGL